ncbi:MAG: hypothetical protein IJ298_09295 [Ruminococcus sp.]|nr:hypothetical protein [Ruminococcus sp.]
MKRTVISACAVLLCLILASCQSVVLTPADELTSRNWQTETASGLRASLAFCEDSASLVIASSQDEVTLSGKLSIDSNRFYITSEDMFRTYTFSYQVYANRAEITYGTDTLVFYPVALEETKIPIKGNP